MAKKERTVSKPDAKATSRTSLAARVRALEATRSTSASARRSQSDVDDLSAAEWAEIDRRVAAHHADPNSAIPWQAVEREMKAVLGASASERKLARRSSRR
ncbi:MAG: addiction module protein [Planctomycetes bacterium]|nr:addiction module protein [Planctomycetota bacterium]